MSTQPYQITDSKPKPGILYGITHEESGLPIIREPRVLKVGIGVPQGKAIRVFIHPSGEWYVITGAKKAEQKSHRFPSRKDAEHFFHETKGKMPERNFPEKLSFFTFTKPMQDGSYEPDFDAIEAHGPVPTEIDIIFMDNDPFRGAYQMWSRTEMQCRGDGINAERLISLATPEEAVIARACADEGQKYFPIVDGCWTRNCRFSKEPAKGKPSPCKPGGDLKFQLAKNLRVGGVAHFHTTGFRSISQLFSCLYRFKSLTGGGDPERGYLVGIPFKFVLRPYTTKKDGQAATQYGVWLEFRAETMEQLQKGLIEQGTRFAAAGLRLGARQVPVPKLLDAPQDPIDEGEDDEAPIPAAAMAAEFYPEAGIDEGDDQPVATPSDTAAAATQEKTSGLAARLTAAARAKTEAPPAVPAVPINGAPAPAGPMANDDKAPF